MNTLIYILIIAIFSLDKLHLDFRLVPRLVTWLPELMGLVLAAIIAIYFIHYRKIEIGSKYVYLMVAYLVIILFGIMANGTSFGTLIGGLRVYLKFLPFFMLGAVYPFSVQDIEKQTLLIFGVLLAQCPVALFQRLIQFRDSKDPTLGDFISGTLAIGGSGILSMLLVCCIGVLFAAYLKKQIGLRHFVVAAFVLFIPTVLSENKATLILLPIAIAAPAFFVQEDPSTRVKAIFTTFLVGMLLVSVFVPAVDYFNDEMARRTGGVAGLLRSEKKLDTYLTFVRKTRKGEYQVGRGYAIQKAFENLSQDPVLFAFGLGIGNTKRSFDPSLDGEHAAKLRRFVPKTMVFTMMFWETGILGLLTYLLFYWFVFKDSRILMKSGGIYGVLALGWTGVVMVMTVSIFYNNYVEAEATNFLFWYCSGLVASGAFRMKALAKTYSASMLLYPRVRPGDTVTTKA